MVTPNTQSPPHGRGAPERQDVNFASASHATSSTPSCSIPQHTQFSTQAFSVSTPSALDSSALTSFAPTSFAPTSSARQPSQQQHHSQQHSSGQHSSRQPPVPIISASAPAIRQAPARQPPAVQSSKPTACEKTPTPTDPTPSKKSFRKAMSSSISRATGKSLRSLSGLFEAMKVADQEEAPKEAPKEVERKTVSEAMEETTLYLNGFSRTSAFKPGVDKDILKELDDVQAKYKEQTVDDNPRRRGRSGREAVQRFYRVP
jgi:hypothetical protein